MNRVYPSRIEWENEPSTNSPINETNLNKMDYAIYEIDGRVVTFDLTKANQSDLLQTVKNVTYDTETGIFTFTFWNGSTVTADLNIEKIPVSFRLTEQGVLIMTTADGTEYRCDIASLIKIYTFADSTEIDFTTTTDASGNKTITAQIKAGSITGDKLQPNYLADCVDAKNSAELAASNAQQSEDDASVSALVSEGWANGKQNGVPVTEGSPYYHNNAEYWKDQANPTRLASLTDVDFSTLKDDEIIVYDATSQKWKNEVGVSADFKSNTTGQFNTRTGGKFESCVINIEPKQSGSGTPSPSNVRPITGHSSVEVWEHGKNMFNSSNVIDGYIGTNPNTIRSLASARLIYAPCKANTTYTVSKKAGNRFVVGYTTETPDANVTVYGSMTDYTATSITITTDATAKYIVAFVWLESADTVTSDVMLNSCQIEVGSRATTYESYQGQDVTVALGDTRYGGTLDVVSGKLTAYFKGIDLGDYNYTKETGRTINTYKVLLSDAKSASSGWINTGICETYKASTGAMEDASFSIFQNKNIYIADDRYSDATSFKTAVTGYKLVYELETPIVIQLTPQQINTLIGENHLDVPLEGQTLDNAVYRELFAWDDVNDVVKAVDDKNADVSAIGTDESGRTTASRSYAQGEHFYKDGKFGKTKTAVAQGATWTLNTNYEEVTIADAFKSYLPRKVGSFEVNTDSPTVTVNVDTHSYYMLYSFQPYVGGHGMFGIATWGSSVILIQTISADSALTITAGTGQITVSSTNARFLTLVKIDENL